MKQTFLYRIRLLRGVAQDENGSAMVGLAFTVITAVFIAGLVGITVNTINTADSGTALTNISAATDARLNQYAQDLNATASAGSPSLSNICYPAINTCVSVSNIASTSAGQTVTLTANYRSGESIIKRVRSLTNTPVSHIIGFDANGATIWGTVSGSTAFKNFSY